MDRSLGIPHHHANTWQVAELLRARPKGPYPRNHDNSLN